MHEKEKSEIEALKAHLLQNLPHTPLGTHGILLSSDSVAIQAAVAGLEKELGRLVREERLLKRFAADSATAGNDNTKSNSMATAGGACSAQNMNKKMKDTEGAEEIDMEEYVDMSKEEANIVNNANSSGREGDDSDEDWEDAKQQKHDQQFETDKEKNRELQKWTAATINKIANSKVQARSPFSAVALALHAALLEISLGKEAMFRCTGTPTDLITKFSKSGEGSKGGGGFAPPIKELPKGVLVPNDWEKNESVIAFRYKQAKKSEGGAIVSTTYTTTTTVYMVVSASDKDESVSVRFGKSPTVEEECQLIFASSEHVNLEGFQAALSNVSSSEKAVSPSLFYKALSELLSKFGSVFNLLGDVQNTFGGETVDATMMNVDGEIASAATTVGGNQTAPITESQLPYHLKPASQPPPVGISTSTFAPAAAANAAADATSSNTVPRPKIPPNGATVDIPPIDPLRVGRGGDFAGDLNPGGISGPSFDNTGRGEGLGGGSQVGPNHPMFDRTFGDDNDGYFYGSDDLGGYGGTGGGMLGGVPGIGGMGMKPRYVHRCELFGLNMIALVA